MNFIDIVGWIGASAFAVSGLPQAIKCVKEGHADGVANGMIVLWLIGEGAMLTYSGLKYTNDFALLTNYVLNAILVLVIAKYKYFPRLNT